MEECHGLPSPHPRLPVTKTFLFPGFTRRTGGVMIENGLLDARDRFSATDRHSLLEALGAREPESPRLISSFSRYPTAPIAQLAEALASDPRPVQVIAAPGRAGEMLGEALSRLNPPQVTFSPVPAVPQESFDRVLWACDALIIRGEDSFVRAQLAGKPFLWTIYPQEEDTHIVKLNAFLDRMAVEYGEDAARVVAGNGVWDGIRHRSLPVSGPGSGISRRNSRAAAFSGHAISRLWDPHPRGRNKLPKKAKIISLKFFHAGLRCRSRCNLMCQALLKVKVHL